RTMAARSDNNSRGRSIILLVPAFPASETETHWLPPIQNFAKEIRRRRSDLSMHVISFQYPYKSGTYLWNECTVHALAGKNRRFPLRFKTWFQAMRHVRRIAASENVIALHSFWLAEC